MSFKFMVKYGLVLALIVHARSVFSMEANRNDAAARIASTLKIQVDEALSGSFAECRKKLDREGLLNSYRAQQCVDMGFSLGPALVGIMTKACATRVVKSLVESALSTEQLVELYDQLTSAHYITFHVETINAIKEAIAQPQDFPPIVDAMSVAQAELAVSIRSIPGSQQNEAAERFARYIASKIDAKHAERLSALIRSEPYQVTLTVWTSSFSATQSGQ